MTATTRTVECNADAILWLAFELGSTKWTLGFTTGAAQRPRIRTISAGDLGALEGEIAAAKVRFSLAADTRVPTNEAEDARQLAREIETVGVDRTRVRNRIHGLLATQGVRLELTARFAVRLAAAQTGDGRPFPTGLRERIANEWAYLQTIEARARASGACLGLEFLPLRTPILTT